MKIRILFFLTFFLFVTVSLFGQCGSTTVNFTITDSDTQVWSNATITANLYNPSHTQVPVCTKTGQKIATSATVHTNGSGHGSMTLTGNTLVSPAGTGWIFTMQPQTSGGPSVSTSISINPSGTQDLSTILSSETVAPRINPSVVSIASAPTQVNTIPWGYNDTEFPIASVVPFQNIVGTYYNVVMQCQRYYDLLTSSWYCGTSTTGPQVIQVNGTPITTESPANFQDTANAAWTNPSAGNIKVTVSGGGIIPPNPINTTYAVLGDSRNLSSTTTGIAIPPATAATCGAGVCTITALNNFKAGDWVGLCCTAFSPAGLNTNPYYYQILSAGLSPTQFEIASSVTGSGTGGPLVNASYNWPLAMTDPNILPNSYFYGHGTVLDYNPTSGETIANLISFYNANVHSISPVITSNPGYLFIHAGYDDYIVNGGCSIGSALAMEPGFQQFWAIAHQDGWKVAQLTNPANSTASGGASCNASSFYLGWSEANEWMKAQGKGGYVAATLGTASASSTSLAITSGTSTALYQAIVATGVPDNTYITGCSPGCGTAGAMTLTLSQATTVPLSSTAVYLRNQWWDYLIDAASELNDFTQNLTQPTNGPHYSDQGNQLIAQLANATFISGNLQLKNQAGNGDSAPNLGKTNWWIPQGTTSGMEQQIQVPNTNTQNAAWESYAGTYGCIGFGYNSNYSVGDGSIYYSPGNICGGGNNYPYLNFKTFGGGTGGDYAPANILFGWSNTDGQGTVDTGLSRDATPNIVDVGPTVGGKTGAMQMAGIGLGTAHVAGHAFDCSGTGCPGAAPAWVSASSGLSSGFVETYPCTVSSVAHTCIHERINTGLLNNASPTTVSLIQSIPNGILGDPVCSDNSGRVQTGNTQPVGANFVGGSAPFSTFTVWVGATSENAMCDVYGW